MKRFFLVEKGVALILCAALLPQVASCGTILYPERQHARHSGQIDIAVALMDGIGLLFFIIPGVVAFAVDFHSGAIYLPKGHPNLRKSGRSGLEDHPIKVIGLDPEKLNAESISGVIFRETGYSVRMDDPAIIVKKPGEGVNIEAELKRMLDPNGEGQRVWAKN